MPSALDVWLPLPVPAFRFLTPVGAATPDAGVRVVVPWQGGLRIGVVADVVTVRVTEALELREAVAILDERPWLLAPARRTVAAQARRTATPIGVALAAMVPVGLDDELDHRVRRHRGVEPDALGPAGAGLAAATSGGGADGSDAASGAAADGDDGAGWIDGAALPADALATWRAHGLIDERVRVRRPSERVLVALEPADEGLAGPARAARRQALAWLERHGPLASAAELARAADVPLGAARGIVSRGYAGYVERPRPEPSPPWVVATPNARSGAADGATSEAPSDARTVLVHGGTAATRLEVLAQAVRAAVVARHQALVLVPEVALVDQVAGVLAADVPTLAFRADLGPDLRASVWRTVAEGTPLALVGTYPAITAPLVRLAQVHVLDAASSSYKLVAGTRTVARRDARVLAETAHAQWIAYDAVATAELRAERVDATITLPTPALRLVTSDLRRSTTWPLGPDLIRVLKQVAERGRQAVVIVPRRGYAAGLACRSCGAPVMCPHCDLPLRWHAQRARLRCHQCGHERPAPAACGACGAPGLAPLPGAGTEWVAREVERVVAPRPVWVVDADHRSDLAPLYDGESGVVVATTAALRLAPPPVCSLVAFTLGDALFGHEDVRAEEQALRTVLAAGELGGGGRPLLLVQTFQGEHPLWHALASSDPNAAIGDLVDAIEQRRARFGYPPALRWARVQVSHRDRGRAHAAAAAVVATLRTAGVPDDALLGPVAASVARIRDRYVVHAFVRAADDDVLADWLERIDRRPGDGVTVRIDVDPYDVHLHLE